MKICHIITALGFGGAERLLVNFTNLQAQNHQVDIIYLKDEPKLSSFFDKSINIHHAPLGTQCASHIRSILLEIKPDVVHTHLGHADFAGFWACRGLKLKLICTMHNVHFKWDWRDKIFYQVYRLAFKTFASHCKVSCVSNAIADHVIKTLGVKQDNVKIIYNSIPDKEFNNTRQLCREKLRINDHKFSFLFLGRLSLQKSVDTLIYAAKELQKKAQGFEILIVGEGERNESLKALVKELNIENFIRFEGPTFVPEEYLHSCDAMILPSVFEGLPTVVLEAFRAKLPVIGSDIDGTNDLVINKQTGLLFECRNASALADCMLEMMNDSAQRELFADNAYKHWKENFSIEKYTQETEQLYLSARVP